MAVAEAGPVAPPATAVMTEGRDDT
jgi:hypothetical protein